MVRRLTVIPLPRRLAYLDLRSAEIAGLPLSLRSDSLLLLANPIGLDDIAALERLSVGVSAAHSRAVDAPRQEW